MSTCFKCGEEYRQVWKAGRLQPLNTSDNRLHWATCKARGPNRPKNRAPRTGKQKELFQPPQSQAKVRGAEYTQSCGKCGVPPWEVCACSFDWAKAGLASPRPDAAERVNAEAAAKFQHMLDLETA